MDVASQGHTIDEALANLAEAFEVYLEEVDDPAGHLTATPLVTSFKLPAARVPRCPLACAASHSSSTETPTGDRPESRPPAARITSPALRPRPGR